MSETLQGEVLPAVARGRPSTFNETVADFICERVAAGEPLRQICREDGMPKWRTVYDWLAANEGFAARFTRARAIGFDAIAEEALEIAEDGRNDWEERERSDGSTYEALRAEHVQRSKLRVETRLKLLAKWDPKRYGDRTTLASDPDNPINPPMDANAIQALADKLDEHLNKTKARGEAGG